MLRVCRTCLTIIDNDSVYHEFFSVSEADSITIKDKLADCIPELLLESVDNAVMCDLCYLQLQTSYTFKQKCLDVQNKIYGYLQQMPIGTALNVPEIAMYYDRLKTIKDDAPAESTNHNNLNDNSIDDLNTMQFYDAISSEDEESIVREPSSVLDDIDMDEFECEQEPSTSPVNSLHQFDPNRVILTPFECTECSFSCLAKSAFRVHVIMHKDNTPPFKCDECTAFLPDQQKLLEHIAVHTNETLYTCRHCDYVTSNKLNYTEHRRFHHKLRHLPKCSECKLKFQSSRELQAHLEVHSMKKRIFYCHLCQYVCTSEVKLQFHLNSAPDHNKISETQVRKLPPFRCRLCKIKYNTLTELELHLKWHAEDKDEKTTCTMCWWKCTDRQELFRHVKIAHRTCHICKICFRSYGGLKHHLESHEAHTYRVE